MLCRRPFAISLAHLAETGPLLLQSTLLHSQTFMLGLVTVSHKAIAKHLRRTRYIDNALGDHTAGKRFRQGKLQIVSLSEDRSPLPPVSCSHLWRKHSLLKRFFSSLTTGLISFLQAVFILCACCHTKMHFTGFLHKVQW